VHFFTAPEILQCLKNFHSWLKKDGRIFIVADSIFHNWHKNKFQSFLQRKNSGDVNPGYNDFEEAKRNVGEHHKNLIVNTLPKYFNFIDIETMANLFNKAGFLVEKASYFKRADYPIESINDGREGVGFIGVKI